MYAEERKKEAFHVLDERDGRVTAAMRRLGRPLEAMPPPMGRRAGRCPCPRERATHPAPRQED